MPFIDVDTERLGQEAEALGAERIGLDRVQADVDSIRGSTSAACAGTQDAGLARAVSHLCENWRYDLEEIGKDVTDMSKVMRSLSDMYGANDQGNARSLRE